MLFRIIPPPTDETTCSIFCNDTKTLYEFRVPFSPEYGANSIITWSRLCDLSMLLKASQSLTGGDSEISYDGGFVYQRSVNASLLLSKRSLGWKQNKNPLLGRMVCVSVPTCVWCCLPLSVTLGWRPQPEISTLIWAPRPRAAASVSPPPSHQASVSVTISTPGSRHEALKYSSLYERKINYHRDEILR